jgi:hypothetical protein
MPLTRPLQDTRFVSSAVRAVTHHEEQSFLAFVLEKLAEREAAPTSNIVDLSL